MLMTLMLLMFLLLMVLMLMVFILMVLMLMLMLMYDKQTNHYRSCCMPVLMMLLQKPKKERQI